MQAGVPPDVLPDPAGQVMGLGQELAVRGRGVAVAGSLSTHRRAAGPPVQLREVDAVDGVDATTAKRRRPLLIRMRSLMCSPDLP